MCRCTGREQTYGAGGRVRPQKGYPGWNNHENDKGNNKDSSTEENRK